jgi:hypothetical protein
MASPNSGRPSGTPAEDQPAGAGGAQIISGGWHVACVTFRHPTTRDLRYRVVERGLMSDIVLMMVAVGFFALSVAYVHACDRL